MTEEELQDLELEYNPYAAATAVFADMFVGNSKELKEWIDWAVERGRPFSASATYGLIGFRFQVALAPDEDFIDNRIVSDERERE